MVDCVATSTETKSVVALFVWAPYDFIARYFRRLDGPGVQLVLSESSFARERDRERKCALAERPVMLRILSKMPVANRRFVFFIDAEICIAIGMISSYEFCDKKRKKGRKYSCLYMNSRYNSRFMRIISIKI